MIVRFQCPRCDTHQTVAKMRPWVRVYLGDIVTDYCRSCGVEFDVHITEVFDDEGTRYTALMRFRNCRSPRAPEWTRQRYRRGRLNAHCIQLIADEICIAGQPTAT